MRSRTRWSVCTVAAALALLVADLAAAGDYTVDTGDKPLIPACLERAPRQPFPPDNFVCEETLILVDQGAHCSTTASRTMAFGKKVARTFSLSGGLPIPIATGWTFSPTFKVDYTIEDNEAVTLTLPGCASTQWVAVTKACKWITCADDTKDLLILPDGTPGNVECSGNPIFAGCSTAPRLNNDCRIYTIGGGRPYAAVPLSCEFGQYGGVSQVDASRRFTWWNHNVGCACTSDPPPNPACPNYCTGGNCPNPIAPMYCAGASDPLVRAEWIGVPSSDRDKALIEWTDNLRSTQTTNRRVEIEYSDALNPSNSRMRAGVDNVTATCPDETLNAFQQMQRLDRRKAWNVQVRYKCPSGTGMSVPVNAYLPAQQVRCKNCGAQAGATVAADEADESCSCVFAHPGEDGFASCAEAPLCPSDCNFDGICQSANGEVAGSCEDCSFYAAYQCRCSWNGSCETVGPICRELPDGEPAPAAGATCEDAESQARPPFCCGDGMCAPDAGEGWENCRRDCGDGPGGGGGGGVDTGCESNWDCPPAQVCCPGPGAPEGLGIGECANMTTGSLGCLLGVVHSGPYCGDGSCDTAAGEGSDACPEDCGELPGFACGNGICERQAGEDDAICRRDCGTPGGCSPSCLGVWCGSEDGCGGVCWQGSGCSVCSGNCVGLVCGTELCGRTCEAGSGCLPPLCASRRCGDGLCDAACGENEASCGLDCHPCAPTSCGALGLSCGTVANGCGGTLSCGSCGANQECASGQCRTCSTQLSTAVVSAPSSGLSGAQVGVRSLCGWTLGLVPWWVTIRQQQGGQDGSIVLDVASSTQGSPRSVSMAVGDQTLRVEQAACVGAATLETTSVSVGGQGATDKRVKVYGSGGCAWVATSNVPWLTITAGSSGAGNGEVIYAVAATTIARTGTITIAGQTFTVTQSK
jgi:hypothetical protein